MFERKKVGLALSGGGVKGLAHIGVLKALEKNNIPIDFISGSSMGAVVGALYSAEPNAKKLEAEAISRNWKELFDYTFPRNGFIEGKKIERFLQKDLNNIQFSKLKIPLYITAFDIERNQEIIFSRGDVAKAVRASISIPTIFVPSVNKNRVLVDGGILDPIPVEVLRKNGAEIIIAVNVCNVKERNPKNEESSIKKSDKKICNVIETTTRMFAIVNSEICRADLERNRADLVITPVLEKYGIFDFEKSKEIIKKGENSTHKSIRQIKKLTEPNIFKEFLAGLENKIEQK